MRKLVLIMICFLFMAVSVTGNTIKVVDNPVDYVSTLVGTLSKHSLSTGNTYPAVAMPWGMNFWTPQTGKMGDGWAYVYTDDKIRGFKQTHQPTPPFSISLISFFSARLAFALRMASGML